MILVTGATGLVGGVVVRDLHQAGVPVRALVRDLSRAADLRDQGVEVVAGDLERPETLEPALAGVERVFLLSPSAPEQVRLQCTFVDAARTAGVRHLVKLSGAHASPAAAGQFPRWHGEIEAYIRASGLASTFVQPVYFMQNYPAQIRAAGGRLVAPVPGDQPFSAIDARDIAAVAAAVLRQPGHEGQTYLVTGPALLTHNEIARTLSAVTGQTIAFTQVAPEALGAGMRTAGQPAWLIAGVLELYASLDTDVTDVVARLTGRAPYAFAQYARDSAAAFTAAVAEGRHHGEPRG